MKKLATVITTMSRHILSTVYQAGGKVLYMHPLIQIKTIKSKLGGVK